MTGDIPIDVANYIGVILALAMYGLYFNMFTSSIRLLWKRRRRTHVVLWITICLFIASTVNAVLFVADGYNAFIRYRVNPGTVYYYQNVQNSIKPLRDLFLSLAAITADVLICWRLFVIWSKRIVIVVFPATLLFIETVVALMCCVMSFQGDTNSGKHHTTYLVAEIIAGACTMMVNLFCTPMIVSRLWWVGRQVQTGESRSMYDSVIVSLVESGALYTGTSLLWMIYVLVPGGDGTFQFLTYVLAMVIAIAPMLIVQHLNATFTRECDLGTNEIALEETTSTPTSPTRANQSGSSRTSRTRTPNRRRLSAFSPFPSPGLKSRFSLTGIQSSHTNTTSRRSQIHQQSYHSNRMSLNIGSIPGLPERPFVALDSRDDKEEEEEEEEEDGIVTNGYGDVEKGLAYGAGVVIDREVVVVSDLSASPKVSREVVLPTLSPAGHYGEGRMAAGKVMGFMATDDEGQG